MKDQKYPVKDALPLETSKEKILLDGAYGGRSRFFGVFLICCALFVAAFAVSAIWMEHKGSDFFDKLGSFWETGQGDASDGDRLDQTKDEETTADQTTSDAGEDLKEPIKFPEGATAIVTKDLAYLSLGDRYIHNETVYRPDVDELLAMDVSCSADRDEPLVLILHTHTSEAYLPAGTDYVEGPIGDATYSRDETMNVIAVGKTLCETLEKKGITAIHCTVMHDDPTLSGAYSRSEATVRKYLNDYPSIRYVIDLHRDGLTTSDGEYIRSATQVDGVETAQIMALVGTDGNGTVHENWENNLALALQLRKALNQNGNALCRPVSLRNASFHQELAERSLLLEIGTGANSVEEAKRAAILVGEALADLLYPR